VVDRRRAVRRLAWRALGIACCAVLSSCARPALARTPATRFWAFTGPWDPRSKASAISHQRQLDVVVSGWIGLDTITGAPFIRYPDSIPRLKRGTRYMSLITSEQNERFRPAVVRALAADPARLASTAGWIGAAASRARYAGLVIDFEGHEAADLPAMLAVIRAIADSSRAHGVAEIAVAIPALDTLAYPAKPLLAVADAVIVMLYDEHWNRSAPGPVASPQWARTALDARVREAGADRVIAGFPLYGYQWRAGTDSAAATVGFDDARTIASSHHVSLARDSASFTLHASSSGSETWVADAVLLDSLVRIARADGVTRVALWRLGLEDPAIWTRVSR
jgi:spore germination protein YaaH